MCSRGHADADADAGAGADADADADADAGAGRCGEMSRVRQCESWVSEGEWKQGGK